MNTIPSTTQRIVVVHGPVGAELADLLRRSGLEAVIDDGDVTIWAPPPTDPPPGERTAEAADPLLVDIPAAAVRLGVSRSTLYRLIEAGQLDVVHVGRSVRVPTAALDELVDRLRRKPKHPGQAVGGHRPAVGSGRRDAALAGPAGLVTQTGHNNEEGAPWRTSASE